VLFAVNEKDPAIYQAPIAGTAGGESHLRWSILVQGTPLRTPSAIVHFNNTLYISDPQAHAIWEVDSAAPVLKDRCNCPGAIPTSLSVSSDGALFFLDSATNSVRQLKRGSEKPEEILSGQGPRIRALSWSGSLLYVHIGDTVSAVATRLAVRTQVLAGVRLFTAYEGVLYGVRDSLYAFASDDNPEAGMHPYVIPTPFPVQDASALAVDRERLAIVVKDRGYVLPRPVPVSLDLSSEATGTADKQLSGLVQYLDAHSLLSTRAVTAGQEYSQVKELLSRENVWYPQQVDRGMDYARTICHLNTDFCAAHPDAPNLVFGRAVAKGTMLQIPDVSVSSSLAFRPLTESATVKAYLAKLGSETNEVLPSKDTLWRINSNRLRSVEALLSANRYIIPSNPFASLSVGASIKFVDLKETASSTGCPVTGSRRPALTMRDDLSISARAVAELFFVGSSRELLKGVDSIQAHYANPIEDIGEPYITRSCVSQEAGSYLVTRVIRADGVSLKLSRSGKTWYPNPKDIERLNSESASILGKGSSFFLDPDGQWSLMITGGLVIGYKAIVFGSTLNDYIEPATVKPMGIQDLGEYSTKGLQLPVVRRTAEILIPASEVVDRGSSFNMDVSSRLFGLAYYPRTAVASVPQAAKTQSFDSPQAAIQTSAQTATPDNSSSKDNCGDQGSDSPAQPPSSSKSGNVTQSDAIDPQQPKQRALRRIRHSRDQMYCGIHYFVPEGVLDDLGDIMIGMIEDARTVFRHPDLLDSDGNSLIESVDGMAAGLVPPPHFASNEGTRGESDENLRNLNNDAEHGTFLAGIMVATRANNMGGLLPGAHITIIPTNDDHGAPRSIGSWGKDIEKVAQFKGVTVVNVSQAKPITDELASAQHIADNLANVLVVVAAGNDGKALDQLGDRIFLKGATAQSNVIGVGAIDENGDFIDHCLPFITSTQKVGCSNSGPKYVHVVAPGHQIFSDGEFADYSHGSGTSVASPQVAATAALLREIHGGWHPDQVKLRLISTSTFSEDYQKSGVWGGALNMERALTSAGDHTATITIHGFDDQRFSVSIPDRSEELKPSDLGFSVFNGDTKYGPEKVSWSKVIRLQREKNTDWYWLVYLDEQGTVRLAKNVKIQKSVLPCKGLQEIARKTLTVTAIAQAPFCSESISKSKLKGIPGNNIIDYVASPPSAFKF
jgi:hypothetical protein